MKTRSGIERFSEKYVVNDNGCFEWTAAVDWYGYGQFQPEGGRAVRMVGAHRWIYEFSIGPIEPGLSIDHLCRNTRCVNVDHLEPVTPHENNIRRGAAVTHCPRGHEYTPENITRSHGNGRSCRTCHINRMRAARAAKREQGAAQ